MCYVHPVHPTLCNHHYYLLLAICGPNASLRTCPSSSLIITGPPGWGGCPKRIEGGLCPRCDLVNEGVDLSRVRFYKPEKSGRRSKHGLKHGGYSSPAVDGPRWSLEGSGLAWARGGNYHAVMGPAFPSPTFRKVYPYSHSVQSLPTPRTTASSRMHDDDSDYSDESSSNQKCRTRRWLTLHIHRGRHTIAQTPQTRMIGGIGDVDSPGHDRGRRRDRLKTVLKKSLSPLKGMVEGIEHKFTHTSRVSRAIDLAQWERA